MMRKTEHALRRDVASASSLLWERGWVANHDGNVTAIAAPGRIVATPTGVSKRLCDAESLIVVDDAARVVRGRAGPVRELGLHETVYRMRADAGAVVHAHPPHATALACLGRALPCFLPESVVSLGHEIPVVPFTPPGAESERALAPFVDGHDVVMLAQHGVLAWGDDVEQAFLRMELCEHLARIAHLAGGAVPPLEPSLVTALLEKRAKAGLGPEGRKNRSGSAAR
jgi:L-fuculose-phosphate aldolase